MKKLVKLIYPEELIKEPVIFTMARQFDVMPNIRKAHVDKTIGEIVLELEGEEKNLEASIRYLESRGIKVELLSEEAFQ